MIISIRTFTKISLVLYFSYFSYGNVLAQTNECPEIPSQQLTISPKEIPLFTTPDSNGEVAYIAKDNETLQLLELTAQYKDGIEYIPDGIVHRIWGKMEKNYCGANNGGVFFQKEVKNGLETSENSKH